MKFDRELFKEAFKKGYKKALNEATIRLNYNNPNKDINSYSTSTNSDYELDINPPKPKDPSIPTPEDKKKIYNALRLQELIAVALHLGWSADEINPWRVTFDKVDPKSNDVGKPDRFHLTDDLRKFLRQNKDVKNKLRSKIDKKEILEICEAAYDTAVQRTLKMSKQLKIVKANAKIRQCAKELRKKICNSVATSLSNRRELSSWERSRNFTAAMKYLGKVLEDPFAPAPDYPYPEDY